ncbi:fatty acid desaturase family protein [Chitinophaga ginsengisoli]|uniref:Linoleoyl-CoA desaturase n=1 Tax=Chitinophaga ginsengisoli TaxID=363837 RepID=A0A2P8G599_9BACT|nr:acyl-CoA desaturase [Chitinophaga ginsengisoli]PSL29161.1 linoleoyl-CoA desaturase [Chitinophaga ginsengisoli]
MRTRKLDIVRFAPKENDGFYDTVKAKVRAYFERNNISSYANVHMWTKTAVMLLLYFVPYVLIVTGLGAGNAWIFFGLWFLMAFGMSGIGTAIMHDANHGTYSANNKINHLIGYILEIIGGYTANWKIQHNILHHTYTNISGLDEDIDTMGLIRLSPNQPVKWFHRYQHLYAWFFYMIMTLYWMTAKDFVQAVRYKKLGLLVKAKLSLKQTIWRIVLYKVFYYGYIIVLPILFSGMPWYFVITGFILMHFTAGLILSCIFQPSHIVETSGFAAPLQEKMANHMENSWVTHELDNTTNFAPRNLFLSWFAGGLNFQIEHHLFTNICHVHYRKLAPIVKETANEFGLVYHEHRTFLKAMWAHMVMLRKLGKGWVRPS